MIIYIILPIPVFFGLCPISRPHKARPPPRRKLFPGLYPGPYRETDPGIFSGPYPASKFVCCVACTERWLESYTFRVPCRHRYCIDCLTTLFEHATKNESMYPPRCCGQVIPLASVRSIISSDLSAAVAKKAIELETTDRTYCATPSCRTFIPPARILKNIAPCLKCAKTTCSVCKNAAHLGKCSPDHNTKLLLKLAEKKKWQFCAKCHNLVARIDGCDEMTCRCGHQFCYDCGGPYGRCHCEYYDAESEWEPGPPYELNRPT